MMMMMMELNMLVVLLPFPFPVDWCVIPNMLTVYKENPTLGVNSFDTNSFLFFTVVSITFFCFVLWRHLV